MVGIHGTISNLQVNETGRVRATGYFDGIERPMGSLAININLADAAGSQPIPAIQGD
jgi:hypothetical protein